MAIVTLSPVGTVQDGAWSVTGASSIEEALADASDESYISAPLAGYDSGRAHVVMDDLELPDGARIVAARVRARIWVPSGATGPSVEYAMVPAGDPEVRWVEGTRNPTVFDAWWNRNHAWHATRPAGGVWTVESLQGAQVRLGYYRALAGGDARFSWVQLQVEYNERPEVAITGPAEPVTQTSRPTITWDYEDAEDDPQNGVQLVVYADADAPSGGWPDDPPPPVSDSPDGADPVWTSGTVNTSATSLRVGADLANDADYQVYVRARQAWAGTGEHWSAWDRHEISIDLDAPAAPSLTATADSQARVLLEVTDAAVEEAAAEWFRVEYRDGDGPWTDVRSASALTPVEGAAAVYDYEAPIGRERQYRATAYIELLDGPVASPPSPIVAATVESDQAWLTDVREPGLLHVPVRLSAHERTWQGREVVHRPAGMDVSVVESEPTTRAEQVSFWSFDPTEHETMVAALRSTRTLLFRDRRDSVFFRWAGDRSSSQLGPNSTGIDGHTGAMVEVARPAS